MMQGNRPTGWIVVVVAALAGCTGEIEDPAHPLEERADDEALMTFEGAEVGEALDASLRSHVYELAVAPARIGLVWDAPEGASLELRARGETGAWSSWQAPTITFDEDGSFAGHVDLADGATRLQFRVTSVADAPSWLSLYAIDEIVDSAGAELPLFDLEEDDDEDDEDVVDEEIGTVEHALSSGVKIHSRKSWGAKPAKCYVPKTSPFRATIHHTVTPTNDSYSPQKRLRQIQSFHMYSNGWCDIGYNYLLSRDGRVWKGRGKGRLGAHVANNNTGNVGISFMGTHTSTSATKTQRCKVAGLLRWLHKQHPAIALNRSDIKGHRQYGSTSCPGGALYAQLDGIVKLAKKGGCK
jgi:hypothetical protein